MTPSQLLSFPTKPRVFILTDITNEPDDEQSFCRYLTYANQFQTEGLVAVTSTWLRDTVAPEKLHEIVDAYERVVDNLNVHVHPDSPYPSAQELRSLIKPGAPVYGMDAVGDDVPLSEGGKLLLERLQAPSNDPLWVLVWGGTNILAQVLYKIQNRPNAAQLRAKLRVYTISDQDDTGAWIRQQWPDVWYICSVHGWNQYSAATWNGISGDAAGELGGPDRSTITNEWLKRHIQIGPLGSQYPDVVYIMEGDTPTFLYLVQNGLGVPEEPQWGSWGGRYVPVNVSAKGTPSRGHFADTADEVVGLDGSRYRSNKATIWRWRSDFQNDFAARMQWTLTPDFSKANHHPIVSVNGDIGITPVDMEVEAGSTVAIDASATYDPDGDELSFKWYQYREPSATHTYQSQWDVADLKIIATSSGNDKVDVTVPPAEHSCVVKRYKTPLERGLALHLILEVTDNGTPPLKSYRRILIRPYRKNYLVEDNS